jgi:hypothetical protein
MTLCQSAMHSTHVPQLLPPADGTTGYTAESHRIEAVKEVHQAHGGITGQNHAHDSCEQKALRVAPAQPTVTQGIKAIVTRYRYDVYTQHHPVRMKTVGSNGMGFRFQ